MMAAADLTPLRDYSYGPDADPQAYAWGYCLLPVARAVRGIRSRRLHANENSLNRARWKRA